MNKKRLVRTVSWPYPSAKYVLETKKAKTNEKKIKKSKTNSKPHPKIPNNCMSGLDTKKWQHNRIKYKVNGYNQLYIEYRLKIIKLLFNTSNITLKKKINWCIKPSLKWQQGNSGLTGVD